MSRNAIPDAKIEIIKATYAETGNLRAASRAANVSVSTAQKYAEPNDQFEHIRTKNRLTVIEYIKLAQIKFIDAMTDPVKLKKASISEISNAFGNVTEKGLLLSGQATSITGNITDPSMRLTPDEMELAAKIREKHAVGVSV